MELLGLLEQGAGLGPHLVFRVTHHANLNAAIGRPKSRSLDTSIELIQRPIGKAKRVAGKREEGMWVAGRADIFGRRAGPARAGRHWLPIGR